MSLRPHLETCFAAPTTCAQSFFNLPALREFALPAQKWTVIAQPRQPREWLPEDPGLATAEIEPLIDQYLGDCELRLLSPRTIETRRVFLRNWTWFLCHRGYQTCGAAEIRQFLHYLGHGHEEDGGRFGKASLKRAARPVTVFDYYICLRSLFDWLVMQGFITATPFTSACRSPNVSTAVLIMR